MHTSSGTRNLEPSVRRLLDDVFTMSAIWTLSVKIGNFELFGFVCACWPWLGLQFICQKGLEYSTAFRNSGYVSLLA
jgi:hypothetical protein